MNWTARSALFTASGLAHIKGIDGFEDSMPLSRVSDLLNGCLEHYGHKWVEKHFIHFLLRSAA